MVEDEDWQTMTHWLFFSLNKVLLEPGHALLLAYCPRLCLYYNDRADFLRHIVLSIKPQIFPISPCVGKICPSKLRRLSVKMKQFFLLLVVFPLLMCPAGV